METRELLPINWEAKELPTIPSIAYKLIQRMCDNDAEIDELNELISQDPALTVKILQICNSALYALNTEVTSVRHAIVLLGQEEVIHLAIGSLLAKRFLTVPKELKSHANAFWHHLMTTAILSKDFELESTEPDLYTLGMLHDLGWLVLMSQAPEVFLSMAKDEGKTLQQLQDAWGVDHELWGAKLLEKWALPEPFQIVAFRHHRPTIDAGSPKYILCTTLK